VISLQLPDHLFPTEAPSAPAPADKSMDRFIALDGFSYAKVMQERHPMRASVLKPEAVKELAELVAKTPARVCARATIVR